MRHSLIRSILATLFRLQARAPLRPPACRPPSSSDSWPPLHSCCIRKFGLLARRFVLMWQSTAQFQISIVPMSVPRQTAWCLRITRRVYSTRKDCARLPSARRHRLAPLACSPARSVSLTRRAALHTRKRGWVLSSTNESTPSTGRRHDPTSMSTAWQCSQSSRRHAGSITYTNRNEHQLAPQILRLP